MTDTCTCPDCRTELEVTEYGRNLRCSECGCQIDVFPEPDLFINTPMGMFEITLPKEWKEKHV